MTSRRRCSWPGTDPLYVDHHDKEWGVPVYDGRALWEHLVLDGFQVGLSWLTILRKRDAFRAAFDGFRPERVARFTARDIARLLANAEIIRSRAKIEAAIHNARAVLDLREAGHPFERWAWSFVNGKPICGSYRRQEDVPAETPLSAEISRALKARSFKFVGPVSVYAWMQAVGLVNDHVNSCFRHHEVARLAHQAKETIS